MWSETSMSDDLNRRVTRRAAIAMSGVAAASAAFAGAVTPESEKATEEAEEDTATGAGDIRLGVCSYSFREFGRKLTIKMIGELGVAYVSVKDYHLPYTLSAAEIDKAKAEFKKAGLTIVSVGNTDLKDEDPSVLRRYFEYARNCGAGTMVAAPTHKTLPAVEKLAKEFDIQVAIHTHGPEDKNFPSPKVVLDAVRNMDPRMGLCMDVGHSMRAGANVVQEIANAGPRLFDIHMKDLKSGTDKDSQCAVGEGVMPVVAIFRQLKKIGYKGCVNLEYEIHSDNPVPGMQRSLGYMKGVLAGLAG
jgi:sugar phosphate isomerase/epimerase